MTASNLPPGVSGADPHFYPPDDAEKPLCTCGDMLDEHDVYGTCMVRDCDCEQYEPDPDDDPATDESFGDHYA